MHRHAEAAVVAAALLMAGCAHLAQPQTWSGDHRTIDLQQDEYLAKELVRGLPEETFRRWYTRAPGWTDPLRPSIQEARSEEGATVYEVGTGAGSAGEVVFRDGALDHWRRWRLMQESVVSAWMKETVRPPDVGAAALARLGALDPASDPPLARERPDPAAACAYGTGDTVETVTPLLFDREHHNRIELRSPPGRGAGDDGRFATLPPGTRLTVARWDVVHGRRLRGMDGIHYLVDSPMGLASLRDVLCPAGACIPPGAEAVTTRDLDIAVPGNPDEPAIAVARGLSRIPVWMTRAGVLPAGTRATVRRWRACSVMDAVIEVGGAGPDVPRVLTIPIAPPGLLVRAGAETAAAPAASGRSAAPPAGAASSGR